MHKLLRGEKGDRVLLLGNEAIARGALEAGVGLASTYPGTPSSEISANFFQISRTGTFYFQYSTNEKVALEVAAAAANSGVRSMCVMKHVGLNVAADALMTLAYVGVVAGLVIVSADDPYMFSSQNEQDNRYYGKLSGLPILEPSTVAEAKEMAGEAFSLSEQLKEPVILRTTTRINHSTGIVELGEIMPAKTRGDFTKDPLNYVTVPAVSRKLHVKLLENLEKAQALSEQSVYNRIEGSGALGVITNGVSASYVSDAVTDLGLAERIRVFRVGFSHPMPKERIQAFLKACEKVLVVEEGEPYMEEAVKAAAQEAGLMLEIRGKGDGLFSRLYELDPATVRRVMAGYFGVDDPGRVPVDTSDVPQIPARPPTLCAGCSHRATFYAVNKAAEGLDTVCPTDIGCYTLGFLPPLSVGDFLICMGSSVGTGCGFSAATGKKVISVIGDSTFFHAGLPGLVNAVFNNHHLTLVILDNGTTAMTGHQPHPGVDMEKLDYAGFGKVSIEQVVRAVGVEHVTVIRPYKVKKSIQALREAFAHEGVSVVISREDCVLFAKGVKRKKTRAFAVGDACADHRVCITELGCPAFYIEMDRVRINPELCTGCAVCAQVCPENAIRPVKKDGGDV